jgi:GxxExxY protein
MSPIKIRDDLTARIIAAAIEVHREVGPGLLESIYEQAICHEFDLSGIPHRRQVPANVSYKGKRLSGQRIDLVVAGEVVIEIKSARTLPEAALAQIVSYLKASGCRRGLIINFGAARLVDGIKRVSL